MSSFFSLHKISVTLGLLILAVLCFAYGLSSDRFIADEPGILTAVAQTNGRYAMFLKLDGIPGESTDAIHRGEIEIDSFAWGESRGVGTARPAMDGFTITMPVNKASATLFLRAAAGHKIPRAVLSVRKPGSSNDFLKWILTDSAVMSYTTVGNVKGDGVSDQVVLNIGKIEVEYKPSDGSPVTKAGWDARTGKSVTY